MRYFGTWKWTSLLVGTAGAVGLLLVIANAWAQQAPRIEQKMRQDRAKMAVQTVEKLLTDFADAVEKNDVDAALELFATKEDLLTILDDKDQARKAANKIRSRIEMGFPEFVSALKDFGKYSVHKVFVGNIRRTEQGEEGMSKSAVVVEGGFISFARDANYLIELRFNVGGVMQVSRERWVLTNLVTRAEHGRDP